MKTHKDIQKRNLGTGVNPTRRERRSAATYETIMRSALMLFANQGYNATTIEDITNTADIGKGTFFNYFPSKEHIFVAYARRRAEKMLESMEKMNRSKEPVKQIIQKLVMSYVDEENITPIMYRNILAAICSNNSVRDLIAEGIEQVRKPLAELMLLGQQRGEIRDDLAPLDVALEFQRIFSGTMLLWAFSPSAKPWTECKKEILNAVWSYIENKHHKDLPGKEQHS
jgi:TetR/AcrR family transcriptional regulator, cholesterol catabolism regulator